MTNTRTLSLVKGDHKYVFRYQPGAESEIVDEIMRLAGDRHSKLNWLDAAMLGFQVAQAAADDACESLLPAEKPVA